MNNIYNYTKQDLENYLAKAKASDEQGYSSHRPLV